MRRRRTTAWTRSIYLLRMRYFNGYATSVTRPIYIYFSDCPWNSTTICIKDGPAVLAESGYSQDFLFQDGLGLLMVTMLWGLLGYYGLKKEERKGYVY